MSAIQDEHTRTGVKLLWEPWSLEEHSVLIKHQAIPFNIVFVAFKSNPGSDNNICLLLNAQELHN